MKQYKTEQEQFWAGEFGDNYIHRNQDTELVSCNARMFAKMLEKAYHLDSIIEFGSNIGLNLDALHALFPNVTLSALEINSKAFQILQTKKYITPYHTAILDFKIDFQRDLSFTKGVLIHINPESLPEVYEKLYLASSKYILMCEYYNPTPLEIPYRGHSEKLYKRDFAGEFMQQFPDTELVDYGFFYHAEPHYIQEDLNWFLMKKRV